MRLRDNLVAHETVLGARDPTLRRLYNRSMHLHAGRTRDLQSWRKQLFEALRERDDLLKIRPSQKSKRKRQNLARTIRPLLNQLDRRIATLRRKVRQEEDRAKKQNDEKNAKLIAWSKGLKEAWSRGVRAARSKVNEALQAAQAEADQGDIGQETLDEVAHQTQTHAHEQMHAVDPSALTMDQEAALQAAQEAVMQTARASQGNSPTDIDGILIHSQDKPPTVIDEFSTTSPFNSSDDEVTDSDLESPASSPVDQLEQLAAANDQLSDAFGSSDPITSESDNASLNSGPTSESSSSESSSAAESDDGSDFDYQPPLSRDLKALQGSPAFNAAFKSMIDAGEFPNIGNSKIECPVDGQIMQSYTYQAVAKELVSPRTGIERFLCCWRTGSGKTYAMIQILENFFHDPRPKICIFPTASVARNFYSEVYRTPSRYRDYILKMTAEQDPSPSTIAAILSLKGQRVARDGELKAPLVAFSYTTGGGSTVRAGKRPFNWRLPEHINTVNPYSGCVVICDEVHNMISGVLTNEHSDTMSTAELKEMLADYLDARAIRYRHKIGNLAENLRTATGAVVVGLTATPIVRDSRDGEMLMSIIKGSTAPSYATNHGYVSYFQDLTPLLYPVPSPDMSGPVFVGSEVRPVPMGAATFAAYASKHDSKWSQAYTNMAFYKDHVRRQEAMVSTSMMSDAESIVNKFKAVVDDLMSEQGKSLVLIHRTHASHGMEIYLRNMCAQHGCNVGYLFRCLPRERKAQCEARNATILRTFNHPNNDDGSIMKVVVADTKDFGEGVSFFKVRNLALVNPPNTWSAYKQQIGRVLRSCDMPGQHIRLRMYVSTLPESVTLTPRHFSTTKTEDFDGQVLWGPLRGLSRDAAKATREFRKRVRSMMTWIAHDPLLEIDDSDFKFPASVTFRPKDTPALVTPDMLAYRQLFRERGRVDAGLREFKNAAVDRDLYVLGPGVEAMQVATRVDEVIHIPVDSDSDETDAEMGTESTANGISDATESTANDVSDAETETDVSDAEDVFAMPNADSSIEKSYKGRRVSKRFPGYENPFQGTVNFGWDNNGVTMYRIVYDDEDEEDVKFEELARILIAEEPIDSTSAIRGRMEISGNKIKI